MIVRTVGEEVWLFDQVEHSRLCGDLAAAWGGAGFEPAPDAVRDAAASHDAGWREWDAAPRLDRRTGLPHPYSDMPDGDYRRIWQRGLERGWSRDDLAGLLISLHAMRFFARRTHAEDRALFAREVDTQRAALARLQHDGEPNDLPEPVATWHEWIFFWDALSLFLCEGWESPWRKGIPARPGGERIEVTSERRASESPGGDVSLDPWPFTGPFRVEAPVRIIPNRRYTTQEELSAAVAAAGSRTVAWRLAPRSGRPADR